MDTEVMRLLQRGVSALESLAEEPEIKVETFPAVCPHCEVMNPDVRVEESQGIGKLGEFVIEALCMECNKTMYAVPFQFHTVATLAEATEAVKERAEIRGY